MTLATNNTVPLTFNKFMSQSNGYNNIDIFLGILSSYGIDVCQSAADFIDIDSEEDDLQVNMEELCPELVAYGNWMNAKVKGYEALRDEGFDAIKENSDESGLINNKTFRSAKLSGEWCMRNGVIYVSYNGIFEAAYASHLKLKRDRINDNQGTIQYLVV